MEFEGWRNRACANGAVAEEAIANVYSETLTPEELYAVWHAWPAPNKLEKLEPAVRAIAQ